MGLQMRRRSLSAALSENRKVYQTRAYDLRLTCLEPSGAEYPPLLKRCFNAAVVEEKLFWAFECLIE